MSSRPARATGAHVSTCEHCEQECGKRKGNYLTRDDAKRATRRPGLQHRGDLRAYRCPSGSGYWHIGNRRRTPPTVLSPAAAQINAMARAGVREVPRG